MRMAEVPDLIAARLGSDSRHLPATPDAKGTAARFRCGSFVEIGLDLADDCRIIANAGYATNGCPYMAAAADIACERLTGFAISEGKEVLDAVRDELTSVIPAGAAGRDECINVAVEAASLAFADHRRRLADEFRGEHALICTCFMVTEDVILDLVGTGKARTVRDITARCGAGGGCGSCTMLIREIIEAASREPENMV